MDNSQNNSDEQLDFMVLPAFSEEQSAAIEKEQRQKLQKYYGTNKKYQISYWYDKLSQFTFYSLCFPINVHEAYILYAIYYDVELTQEDQIVKNALITKADNILGKIEKKSKTQVHEETIGCFMKLSTRSPKDRCWDYRDQQEAQRSIKKLAKYIKQCQITKQSPIIELNNILYKFFLLNSKEKLLVTSGEKFIQLFGRSDRIIMDICDLSYLYGGLFQKLKEGKLNNDKKQQFFIDIWARQWEKCDWHQEIRVFYHNYRVTAITQYDQYCYFKELKGKNNFIQKQVQQYFSKLLPRLEELQLSEGVMDVIIKQNGSKLIQINVFNPNSRPSLFDWKKDEQILKNGPVQVRFLEQQKQITKANLGSIMGMIDKNSIHVIEQALKQLQLYEMWEKNEKI